jgi:hypothetical protein
MMVMKQRRLTLIFVGLGLGTSVGWLMIDAFNRNCGNLTMAECRFLLGTGIASIVGGALFLETLIAYKKAKREWQARKQDLHSNGPVLSSSQVWIRSIARVVLASLLVGLPVIVKGTIVIAVCGAIVGLSVGFLVRGIMNWLPPIEEDNQA